MKSDWLKRLKAMLDKQGIKTSAELFFTDEQARDMLENPQVFMTPLSKMSDDLVDALKHGPKFEIINVKKCEYFSIDLDITPMLDRIESQQLSKHIKWMRELT
jgi:hypothetical protein